ncbi:MAG TPA: hypothetical protein VIJ23_19315, partial [Mycobacterium sp.]
MTLSLRDVARWSAKPARDVGTAITPKVNVLRGLAARATTPLLPDDYLKLLNPLRTSCSKPPPTTPPSHIPNSSSASGPGCGRASESTPPPADDVA